ncbi:hypothetical protein GYB22_08015 [bacterium]|nr:hypothetical protein [bacterium]
MSDKYNKEEESVLQKIQNQTGCLLLVIGVAMLAFVLTDLLSSRTGIFGGGPSANAVGEINGESVSYTEYDNRYKTTLLRAQQNNPGLEINAQMQESFKQQAWNSIVQEKLVQREYNDLGLTVSGAELEDITLGANTHPQLQQAFKNPETNQFDKAALSKFLREDIQTNPDAKEQWIIFENELTKQIVTEKYTQLLELSYYVTELEARHAIFEEQAVRGVNVVGLNYATIADSTISVSDAEIKAYLNDHKAEYEQEASRDIEYVKLNVIATAEDTASAAKYITDIKPRFEKSEDDSSFVSINNSETPFDPSYLPRGKFSSDVEDDIFNADNGEVLGPYLNSGVYSLFKVVDVKQDSISSVRASHILFRANSGDTLQALADARKALADIRAGRADFAELAKEKNVDASRNQGGDLGWLRKESFNAPKKFIDEAKRTPVGGYFIVKTKQGAQLGKVTGAPTRKTVQVAQMSVRVDASTETDRAVYRQAGELLSAISTEEGTFEEIVERNKFTKGVAKNINEKDRRVSGIDNGNIVARWLFADDTEEGDVSDILEFDNMYVIARVSKVREEGMPDIEDVREKIEPLVRDQKKAEKLRPQVEEAIAKAEGATALAKELNTVVTPVPDLNYRDGNIPYVGQDEKLVGAAFGTKIGERTDVLTGKNGVYVIFVEREAEIKFPDDLTEKQVELREQKTQTLAPAVEQALVDLGNVKDQRYKFY